MEKIEVRSIIKYLHLKGSSPKEIFEELRDTLVEDAPGYSTVKFWVAEFKRGRVDQEDQKRSVFWDAEGIVMTANYLKRGERVTGSFYSEQLKALKIAIRRKRPEMLRAGVLLLQGNVNAPAHCETGH